MAQRIRTCSNNTNLDTINCDSYVPRLLKRDKLAVGNKQGFVQRCSRDCSASNTKVSAPALLPMATNLKLRTGSVRQQNLQPVKNQANSKNVVHKEIISDNSALVEVTVRTHNNRRSHTGNTKSNNRQTWGKLLKPSKSNDNLSSFDNFDPLRTLHFLAKELRSKLKKIAPNDPNMLQMISDMQNALNRVPQEIASSICLQHELENPPLKRSVSETRGDSKKPSHKQMELPEKLEEVKSSIDHKSCQTPTGSTIFTESEVFQKQLEASTHKLEETCKAMEKLCSQLKSEKEEVELLLLAEKDTVKFLRKQTEELETEKAEVKNYAFEQLTQEREKLQTHIKKLQAQIDSQQGSSLRELKSLIQQLQVEKTAIEQENLTLRHKLTLSNIEKEKYVAILSVRDRQIHEIRTEMNQLQEIVNEQLIELQKSSFISSPSSQSTVVGNFTNISWQQLQANIDKHSDKDAGDNFIPSSINSEPPVHHSKDPHSAHSFKQLSSGDSSASNLECLTSKMKKIMYESGLSPPKVIKLFSSANTTAGI